MNRWADPAGWRMRWWAPLAAAAAAAGLWLEPPGAGPPPHVDARAVESPPFPRCGELEDAFARAACNTG